VPAVQARQRVALLKKFGLVQNSNSK
jgi:hypothetical protein